MAARIVCRLTGIIVLSCLLLSALPAAAAEVSRATGKVMATVTRLVIMPFNGIVDEVLVHPGDRVEKGAPLLRYHLEVSDERQLAQELSLGGNNDAIRSDMLELQSTLAETVAQRNKARQLAASGLGSRQALSRLEQDVTSLQERIELLRTTIRKNDDNFQRRLAEIQESFEEPLKPGAPLPSQLVLTAPISGHVLSVEGFASEGALVPRGSKVIMVGRLDPVIIQVPVYEGELSNIAVGDKAEVAISSLRDKVFAATVSEISWTANDMSVSNPSYYKVELRVPNPNFELKPGYKAVVRFAVK